MSTPSSNLPTPAAPTVAIPPTIGCLWGAAPLAWVSDARKTEAMWAEKLAAIQKQGLSFTDGEIANLAKACTRYVADLEGIPAIIQSDATKIGTELPHITV